MAETKKKSTLEEKIKTLLVGETQKNALDEVLKPIKRTNSIH